MRRSLPWAVFFGRSIWVGGLRLHRHRARNRPNLPVRTTGAGDGRLVVLGTLDALIRSRRSSTASLFAPPFAKNFRKVFDRATRAALGLLIGKKHPIRRCRTKLLSRRYILTLLTGRESRERRRGIKSIGLSIDSHSEEGAARADVDSGSFALKRERAYVVVHTTQLVWRQSLRTERKTNMNIVFAPHITITIRTGAWFGARWAAVMLYVLHSIGWL